MDHLQTSKFICKILSYRIKNDKIKSYKNINWESVIKIGSKHLSLPTIYFRLKERRLTNIIPKDLIMFLKKIYLKNEKRNINIIKQINFINKILIKEKIDFCFIKGSSDLIINHRNSLSSRMISDIDLLISETDFNKSIEIFKKNN